MKNDNWLPSGRELEVLALIAQGKSSKHIADILGTSVHTVNKQRKDMLGKTGVQNMAELVARYVNSRK